MSVAVIGSGPNGLAAAIAMAEAGLAVEVFEQHQVPGGACRTESGIVGDCLHDHCATVMPLAIASPFFAQLGLNVQWLHGRAVLAHPLDGEPAVLLDRSLETTSLDLGHDGARYRGLFSPLIEYRDEMLSEILQPLSWPANPFQFAKFGLPALLSMNQLNAMRFRETRTRALMAGMAAHAMVPLSSAASSATALVLGMLGHSVGWPIAAGGAQSLTDRLIDRLLALDGSIVCDHRVTALGELGHRDAIVFDTSPGAMARIGGDALPSRFHHRLGRFRHGPGVFKVDWVLDGSIPWSDSRCDEAVTVHLGGTAEEIARSEAEVWAGGTGERPFVILTQPSTVDPSRAPAGKQVVWAYCHVPYGSTVDMSAAIERQIERFAPGFRDRVLGRQTTSPAEFARTNPNLAGGDISGGAQTLGQMLARPYLARDPYRSPNPKLFLGSSSTPPGGGVHGMCGFNAATSVLRQLAFS